MVSDWRMVRISAAALIGAALLGTGCGVIVPTTHAVKGKVKLVGGDVRQLAGGHVEAVLPSDRRIQATGEIQADGSFSLRTIHAGQPLEGAREGEYQARIVLSDEDSGSKLRRGVVLAPHFAQFRTSGLTIKVPVSGEVILQVAPR